MTSTNYKMNRAKLMVKLAKHIYDQDAQSEEKSHGTNITQFLDEPSANEDRNPEDLNIVPELSYEEKVLYYLQNVENENKDAFDPYDFREVDNEDISRVNTDNFFIERKNDEYYIPKISSLPYLDNPAEPLCHSQIITVEQNNIANPFETNLNRKTLNRDTSKIHILEHKNFPSSKETVDNEGFHNFDYNKKHVIKNEEKEKLQEAESYISDEIKRDSRTLKQGFNGEGKMFRSFSDDNSSDVDYIPPSVLSGSSTTNSILEEVFTSSVEDKNSSAELPLQPTIEYQHLPVEFITTNEIDHSSHFKNKLKKVLCPFCFEEVDHFSRHLLGKHSDENIVKKISEMPLKTKERRMAIMSLRKKGNFILHEQKNTMKVVRAPSNLNKLNNDDYFPCVHCLGFYKKSYLWRHNKICNAKMNKPKAKSQKHLTESQTFLATTGMLGNVLNRSRIKNEVFGIMRPDDISYTAKTDPLICLFGESYINKHKRKQMNTVVSNKMRELARLKLALKTTSKFENLIDILKPECYDLIVAATKLIAGYDAENKTFTASSLALHMGTTLKFICDVATKAILTKNPLFITVDRETKIKEIKQIRNMVNMHWCNDVSSLANKVLNEQKSLKPKLLPFTEDIKTLNTYVRTSAEKAFNSLKNNEDIETNYRLLTECALILVLIFNRKRIGEVQFLKIASYKNLNFSLNQEECLNSLSELEKNMSHNFKRVTVFGKGSKPVPILFTNVMQRYIEMILTLRENTEVVPKSNPYVFASPASSDRWMSGISILRKYAYKCGAKNPELLTSTRFRKQLATILQLMNFENDEMEQIARFMGHTEKTHKEFYRLTEDVYQTAKVAKVLLLLNIGKGSEFKGKSLAEIELGDDVMEYEVDSERANSKEKPKETCEIENVDKNKMFCQTFEQNQTENTEDQSLDQLENSKTNNNKVQLGLKKNNRKRWAVKEKQLVLKYFKKHIISKTAPKKQECLNFIEKNSSLFSVSDCVRIKTLVFNTYRSK